jgi:hypothetical protein
MTYLQTRRVILGVKGGSIMLFYAIATLLLTKYLFTGYVPMMLVGAVVATFTILAVAIFTAAVTGLLDSVIQA